MIIAVPKGLSKKEKDYFIPLAIAYKSGKASPQQKIEYVNLKTEYLRRAADAC